MHFRLCCMCIRCIMCTLPWMSHKPAMTLPDLHNERLAMLGQTICFCFSISLPQEGNDGSLIGDAALAEKICELLQVSRDDFTRTFQYFGASVSFYIISYVIAHFFTEVSKRNSFHRSTAVSVHFIVKVHDLGRSFQQADHQHAAGDWTKWTWHGIESISCRILQAPQTLGTQWPSICFPAALSLWRFYLILPVDGSRAVFLFSLLFASQHPDWGILDYLIGLCGASTRAQLAMS